jgi:hypothetical protein
MAEEMRETSVEDRRNRRRALDAMGIHERKDAEMKPILIDSNFT